MSYAFNLADPQFSAPELNAPRACAHTSNCYYNGPNGCAFVHPGEEGTGMKIFPARSFKDQVTGKETWQKPTVRLIGSAAFYERRRLKMSWPAWCALPKNSHLIKPRKATVLKEEASVSPQCIPLTAEFKRQQIGEALYSIITPFLAQNEKDMKDAGFWHPNITAGKVTGMLLEGFSEDDLYSMLTNTNSLNENIAECCDLIKAHAN